MLPEWVNVIASISLVVAGLCSVVILVDLFAGNRQKMGIMNVVWPVTALWAGPIGLWAYFATGRKASMRAMKEAKKRGETPPMQTRTDAASWGLAASHCGAGCTLGDLCAETFVALVPVLSIAGIVIDWKLFGHKIFGTWVLDYVLAFAIGVAFQYFTIKPMRDLSPGKGVIQAVKADALSLTSWQVGMYGWMAIAHFWLFPVVLGAEMKQASVPFWFMMQIAMFAGFATAYPVNVWLVRSGIKEKM